jgi:hypothetical protein
MAARLTPAGGNVYRLEVSGRLRGADLFGVERLAAAEIGRAGAIRLLVVLNDFEGWDARDEWRDIGFYVRHGDDIERIAIVGDPRWRGEALMFVAAGLRRAPVRFFDPRDRPRAEDWLAE